MVYRGVYVSRTAGGLCHQRYHRAMDANAPSRGITWAALLARWTEFARSSLALPRNAEGERWRRAVPSIIGLQAVTQALGECAGLPPDELALGLDRAAILIDRHAAELAALWSAEPLHPELVLLIDDARGAHAAAALRRREPAT